MGLAHNGDKRSIRPIMAISRPPFKGLDLTSQVN
jgi:hypothetical protein